MICIDDSHQWLLFLIIKEQLRHPEIRKNLGNFWKAHKPIAFQWVHNFLGPAYSYSNYNDFKLNHVNSKLHRALEARIQAYIHKPTTQYSVLADKPRLFFYQYS
jgi:hypothetical protein